MRWVGFRRIQRIQPRYVWKGKWREIEKSENILGLLNATSSIRGFFRLWLFDRDMCGRNGNDGMCDWTSRFREQNISGHWNLTRPVILWLFSPLVMVCQNDGISRNSNRRREEMAGGFENAFGCLILSHRTIFLYVLVLQLIERFLVKSARKVCFFSNLLPFHLSRVVSERY